MLCCIAQKAASRREKIPPGTKFLVKHDTILQQKEELRIDTARRVWDNGGNKQNAKGVVTMFPELRWLSDPTVFAVNRLDAHSDHVCCRSAAEAAAGLSTLRQSLNGAWRFAWSPCPAARPADFWQPDADLRPPQVDLWGADVEDAYHVSGEGNHSVAFRVLL